MAEIENEAVTEVEVVENGAETGLVMGKPDSMDIVGIADKIEQWAAAANKIRTAVMKLALPGDWVIFGSEEKGKVGELGAAGAERVASFLPFSFSNWMSAKEKGLDDKGEWYRWEFEADATLNRKTIRFMGRAGSRDKFFGKANGELKIISDISEGDIKMAARRAVIKEAVRSMLGLRHIPLDMLTGLGVKVAEAKGHTFGNKTTAATDDDKKRQLELGKWLLDLCAGDKEQAQKTLEHITEFKGNDGKMVSGVTSLEKLTGTRLNIAHSKIKKQYEEHVKKAGE